jgi:hypothetical protein
MKKNYVFIRERQNDRWSHYHISENHARNYFKMVGEDLSGFKSQVVYIDRY